jgi:hypothetical protein
MNASDVKTTLPELIAVPDDVVQQHLTAADPFFEPSVWGSFYARGLCNFVAHNIVMELVRAGWKGLTQAETSAQGVTSKSISGAVSWSIDSSVLQLQMKDPIYKTTYGQEYAYLRDFVGMGGVVV